MESDQRTGDAHPKHIHLVQFQVISRQAFNQNKFDSTGELQLVGSPQAPAPEEQNAYKDTVKSYPGTVTTLPMKFDMPAGTPVVSGQRLQVRLALPHPGARRQRNDATYGCSGVALGTSKCC